MAPVIRAVHECGLDYSFILTGQHQETMDDLIVCFKLRKPDAYFLPLGESETLYKLLIWLYKAFIGGMKVIRKNSGNDIVLVHGDTLSTLLAAFISKLKGIRVVHVEAGLRSNNLFHPFPEEIIRLLVTRLSDVYICQNDFAVRNIETLGDAKQTFNIGANTLLDSLATVLSDSKNSLSSRGPNYCVVSMHRSENLTNPVRFSFLMRMVIETAEVIAVKFVLHPATRAKLETTGWMDKLRDAYNISLLPRMDYTNFIGLLYGANFLITDGGSNQEETSYLNIPCLVMRKATERIEGLNTNVVLSKYDKSIITEFIQKHATVMTTRDIKFDLMPSRRLVGFLRELTI